MLYRRGKSVLNALLTVRQVQPQNRRSRRFEMLDLLRRARGRDRFVAASEDAMHELRAKAAGSAGDEPDQLLLALRCHSLEDEATNAGE